MTLGLALAAASPSFATDWTGAASTDWFAAGNWSGGVPTSGADAKIDTVTPNATVVGASATGAQALNLSVGYWGTGRLTIRNGGAVNNAAGFLGFYAHSTGTATVDGAGSSWTNGDLYVGNYGTGTLTIQNGGAVSNGLGYIGFSIGSTGTVTVTGIGSSWTNSGDLAVGNFGAGTLTILNGGAVSNVTSAIAANGGTTGAVTVTGAGSSWTNSGDLYLGDAGTGALTIQNGGAVNVAGFVVIANNAGSTGTLNIGAASGQTAVAPGTLNAASVMFGAGTGSIVFNHTASGYVFAPAISGAGAVTVEAGTTILTGASSGFTGTTTVRGGTLAVNGVLGGSLAVLAAGRLQGTGTVGGTTVSGTLAPGHASNPTGTLTIAGNLAFQSGAVYLVQVTPSAASSTAVAGTASLTGATVNAVFAGGSLSKQSTLLTASGRLGGTTFAGLTNTNLPAGFTDSLSYSGTSVFLNLTAALGATGGLNGNQQNVANALDNFFNNGGALPPSLVGVFGLTGGNLSNALAQLSGEAATGGQQGTFQFMGQFLGLMLDPFVDGRGGAPGSGGALGFAPEREALPEDVALAYARVMKAPAYKALPAGFEPRWTAWASGFGGYNKTSGDPAAGSNDLTARAAGVAAGLDYRVSRDAVVGFSLAGGGTSWDLAQGLGGGKSDTFAGGVYGAVRSGPAYVAASFGGGNHWMSTDRFAAFGDHLTASFNGESFGGRIEGGYRFALGTSGITPYAALQAQSFHTPTYSETDLTGGGFGLTYQGRTATDTRSEVGARFDQVALVNPDAVLIVRGRLAWAHDRVSDPTLAAVFQALPGASFLVNGATPAKDAALVSAGAELKLAKGISLLGKFDGEFAGRAQTYAGTGTVRVSW